MLNKIVRLLNCENNLDLSDRDFIKFFENRGLIPRGFLVNTILLSETERITLFIDYVISNLTDDDENDEGD